MSAAVRWRPSRWMLAVIAATLPIGVAAPRPAVAQRPVWQVLSNSDGFLLERRLQEGANLYELRATVESPLPPAAIFDTIWRQQDHPTFVPYLKRLDILRDTGNERLTYEQVTFPMVQDRDYTVRLEKRVDPSARRYEILFATANELGAPPDPKHFRISTIRGRWLVEPGPGGAGSRLRYELFSDPGGSLPAWLVNRGQSEAVPKLIRAMLDRTRERAGRQ